MAERVSLKKKRIRQNTDGWFKWLGFFYLLFVSIIIIVIIIVTIIYLLLARFIKINATQKTRKNQSKNICN